MGCCCLPPDRVKLTVNNRKNKQQVQNGPWGQDGLLLLPPERVKMGCCFLPPDRVKLAVKSKKETSSRVKMGQGSRWASVIYPLKESKWAAVVYPLTESI